MTNYITSIPDSLKDIVKDISITKINIYINLENNYAKIYPDDESDATTVYGMDQSNDDTLETQESQNQKINITFEEWQYKLKGKYDAIRETCDKNFPGLWHSLEF